MIDRRQFIEAGAALAGALAASGLNAADAKPTPGATVATTAGKVRGLKLGNAHAFKGIPYGGSTAPPHRFMPPRKPQPWKGVRDAFELGHRSPQLLTSFHGFVPPEIEPADRDEPMSEDCLRLNVWTPRVDAGKRPVMVWLHGGGYTSGSGGFTIYDGEQLAAKHDVVVVTVNHRLTAFGYMYFAGLGDARYAQASNVGQLDIVAALEWVRDNIARFGGDAANVTIFGQSGGAGKVSALMAMPAAKGLFHRAIVQSGAAVRGIARDAATAATEAFLKKLGADKAHLDKLQTLTMQQILAATEGAPLSVGPVVDGQSLPNDPFDPTAPAQSADIPLLIGTTETEVTFFPGQMLDPIDDAALHARVKGVVRGANDAQVTELIAAYKTGRPQYANTDIYLIIASDATFRAGVVTEAERKAQQAKAPVYHYYFTWRSPVREGKLRSMHCMEIPFVFDNVDSIPTMVGTGKDRYALATCMSTAWTAFARTGNPNHAGAPRWDAFDPTRRATMIFSNDCKLVNDPYGAEQRVLQSLLARSA